MTVGKAIYYLLTNSTDIAAIVSTRVFPEVAQQDAPLPYVVYNVTNNEPSDTKAEPSELDTANVEVNCFSTSYTESIDLAVAVRAALDRVTGTYNGVNVQSIAYMNETLSFEEAQRAYLVSSDYDVRIARSDFEIAQGSPITGVTLGELSDVEIAGVTDNQVLSYDSATNTWVPATDAGGAEDLNDLTDVIISAPESGEFFRYDGGEWVNDTAVKGDVGLGNVDNTSDANKPVSTATQTALDLKANITSVPTELDDLDDIQIIGTPTLGQALVYGAGKWLPGAAGATTLGALDDVNTTGAAAGSLLTYNGATGWDISASELPSDDIYFHQRYETESEALRAGATATVELYFTCTAQGNGLAESASSDTPTTGYVINRKIYYSEAGFADPDTGTWVEFTPAPADDASFATAKAALLEHLKARTGGTVPISLKQTWEETAVAPAFTGLLNESYGSGAAAAYSTRRLNGNYTGACMTIRRASDSTTTTIGFSGEEIDEAAITTFCTGTTCTVVTWHDQSQTGGTGVGNDATAASTGVEPTIYTGGALVKDGGRVSMTNTGTDKLTASVNLSQPFTGFNVGKADIASASNYDGWWGSGSSTYRGPQIRPTNLVGMYWGTSITSTFVMESVQQLYTAKVDGASSLINVGGTNVVSGNSGTNGTTGLQLFGFNGGGEMEGSAQEFVFFDSAKSASDTTSIEENVGDYFTQNTPLLDTYTGAAACYSLRLMRTAYTGDCIEVYNGSSYADIGFNVFGELDTVALADHCGSSDGTIRTWYDQAGSNDATQSSTAAMPKIYDGTTGVVTENGKPAIDHQGTGYLDVAASISDPFTMSVVMKHAGSTQYVIGGALKPSLYFSGTTLRVFAGSWSNVGTASASQANYVGIYDAAGTGEIIGRVNTTETIGSSAATSYTPNAAYQIGASGTGGSIIQETMQEVVIWNSNQKSATNIDGIQTNINTFYSIY